jgi:hypothetical protein
MHWWQLIVACAALACSASSASGQPARGHSYFELVDTSGSRQDLVFDAAELELLPTTLTTRQFEGRRAAVRMLCSGRCPEALPRRRPAQDVIVWEDGRRTSGAVFVFREIVEQNGERAGRIGDVRTIELGTARLNAGLVRGLQPQVVEAYWADPWGGGEYVVLRQPWVTLSPLAITFHGRPPLERGPNLRSIRLAGDYPNGRAPWPEQDSVTWQDGTRTTGPVTIAGGFVRQPGQRQRPFREVAYIDLARR